MNVSFLNAPGRWLVGRWPKIGTPTEHELARLHCDAERQLLVDDMRRGAEASFSIGAWFLILGLIAAAVQAVL